MIYWPLSPVLALLTFMSAFFVDRYLQRKKKAPWVHLLSRDANTAAATGDAGVLDGIATDGGGRLAPLVAPFSGRPCLAFHIEVMTLRDEPRPRPRDEPGRATRRGP